WMERNTGVAMGSTGLELRPRNILDLMDGTVRLYRRNFSHLLGISAIVLVPLAVVQIIGQYFYVIAIRGLADIQPGQMPNSNPFEIFNNIEKVPLLVSGGFVLLYLVLLAIAGPLSNGALAIAISEKYLGRDIGLKEAYRRALPCWGTLFIVAVMYGLLVMFGPLVGGTIGAILGALAGAAISPDAAPLLGMLGAVLGGLAGVPLSLLFTTWFILYIQVAVIEGVRGVESLQRSRELVREYGWHTFGAIVLTSMAIGTIAVILTIPIQGAGQILYMARPEYLPHVTVLTQCVAHTIQVLLGPIFMIMQTLLYYDLRIRKEGFDLHMMAAALRPGEDLSAVYAQSPLAPSQPVVMPGAPPPIVGPAVPPPAPPPTDAPPVAPPVIEAIPPPTAPVLPPPAPEPPPLPSQPPPPDE
ncbi:MAG TPA: hypothetical protein QGH10_10365, partial [Armatimonadota bacterium]|nr:hypothetical protein [Armatimonadota bacterium]